MNTPIHPRRRAARLAAFLLLFLSQPLLAYYCPSTGRFLSRDPVGERGGENVYLFVRNNPTKHWDVLGLKKGCCNCNWKIYFGHSTTLPDPGAQQVAETDFSTIDKCTKFGYITCNAKWLNSNIPDKNSIPRFGDVINDIGGGYDENDYRHLINWINNTNNGWDDDFPAVTPLTIPQKGNTGPFIFNSKRDLERLGNIRAMAKTECRSESTCCKNLTIRTKCSAQYRRYFGSIYQGLHFLQYNTDLSDEQNLIQFAILAETAGESVCNQEIKISPCACKE